MTTQTCARMTLFQVVELCDDLTAIRVACAQTLGNHYDPKPAPTAPRYLRTLAALTGSKLTVARVLRIKRLWRDWTGRDGVTPQTVQGFLWSHKLEELTR